MLSKLLTQNFVELNVHVVDWKEAIKKGAFLLEEKKYIDNSYVDAIFKNFEEDGPYMVIAPGVVLSHAGPEYGVHKIGMSLITLEEPVNFGNEKNDPVKLIITLAAIDNKSHLKALSQLMDLLMSIEDVEKIIDSNSKKEVLETIAKYS